MIIQRFLSPQLKLLDLPSRDARHILAARSWCLLRQAGLDPRPRLSEILLSESAGQRFNVLMVAVVHVWPEPFAVHRMCCDTPSFDEGILLRALQLGATGARPQFDALLYEMLSEDARNVIFARASSLYTRAD
nr:hypothetical protein [uncultured Sphingorhabdus sp.]